MYVFNVALHIICMLYIFSPLLYIIWIPITFHWWHLAHHFFTPLTKKNRTLPTKSSEILILKAHQTFAFFHGVTLFRAGVLFAPPPSGFSCATAKRRKTESSYLVMFSKYSFRTFQQKSCWARSGHQRQFVELTSEKFAIPPDLEFSTDQFPLWSFLSGYHYVQFVYLSIFISVTWGRVRFVICALQAYGKILKCVLLWVNESKPPNSFWIYDRLFHLRWSSCHLLTGASGKVTWCHMRSSIVHCQ